MKRLLFATTALAFIWATGQAKADSVLLDPLHGTVCSGVDGTGCNATEVGGVVPGNFGSGSFGFNSSPAGATGDLTVAILIPDNELAGFTLPTISGTGLSGATALAPAGGGGDWLNTSKLDLAQFIFGLSANSSPSNPQSAFSGPSSNLDPSLTGFFVFTADAGLFGPPGLNGQNATTTPDHFTLSGLLPAGATAVGFLTQTDGSIISTAPSGQIQSVPGPLVGAGIPGLLVGCLSMVALARRRISRSRAAA